MRITAKYPGTCTACRGRYSVGEQIDWKRDRKGQMHVECAAQSAQVDEPVAQAARIAAEECQAIRDLLTPRGDDGDWWPVVNAE